MIEKVSTALDFLAREKEVIKFWNENDIFKKSMKNREGQPVSEARRQKAAATAAVKGARRGPVTIGRDGHVQGGTRTGLPRPVQRINRKKGSGM